MCSLKHNGQMTQSVQNKTAKLSNDNLGFQNDVDNLSSSKVAPPKHSQCRSRKLNCKRVKQNSCKRPQNRYMIWMRSERPRLFEDLRTAYYTSAMEMLQFIQNYLPLHNLDEVLPDWREMTKPPRNEQVSKLLGLRWKHYVDEETKELYERLAQEEKRIHMMKYPGYKYIPRKGLKRPRKHRSIGEQTKTKQSEPKQKEEFGPIAPKTTRCVSIHSIMILLIILITSIRSFPMKTIM